MIRTVLLLTLFVSSAHAQFSWNGWKKTFSANAVDSSSITDGGVSSADLRTAAVGAAQLAPTAVTAGSYTNTNLTVDADGRITTASNGTGGSTFIWATANKDSAAWAAGGRREFPGSGLLGTTTNGATPLVVNYLSITAFDTGDSASFDFRVPALASGAVIDSIEVETFANSTAGDSVQWSLVYKGVAEGEIFNTGGFSAAITAIRDMGATAYARKRITLTTFANLSAGDTFVAKLYRTNGGNDMTAQAYVGRLFIYGPGIR